MSLHNLDKLAALIKGERAGLLSRWREQVRLLPSAKHLDTPTLNDHVPPLLDELATALRSVADKTIPEALVEGSPPIHGLQRYQDGFDIVEVVAEYNILRGESSPEPAGQGFSHLEPCVRRGDRIGHPDICHTASSRIAATA